MNSCFLIVKRLIIESVAFSSWDPGPWKYWHQAAAWNAQHTLTAQKWMSLQQHADTLKSWPYLDWSRCSAASQRLLHKIGLTAFSNPEKKEKKKKKKRISSLEKLQVKNESDKNRNKERIAFWCSLYSAGFRGGTKQTLPQTSLTLVTDVEMVISISHHQRWQQWLAVFMQFQMPLVYCQRHLKRQALK